MYRKTQIFLLVFTLLLIYLFFEQMKSIQNQKVSSWTEDQRADCAVVLTGGSGRVQEGVSLLHQNRVQKLIISGVHPAASLAQIFPPLPFYGGLEQEDIILEKRSKTTYGNARQSLPIIGALNCQTLILITSRLHMYRALGVFKESLGEEVTLIPRAIYSKSEEENLKAYTTEIIKSLFYNIWAY